MGPETVDTSEAIQAEGARARAAAHIEQELTPVAATMAAEAQAPPATTNLAPLSPAQTPSPRGDSGHRFSRPRVTPLAQPQTQLRPAFAGNAIW